MTATRIDIEGWLKRLYEDRPWCTHGGNYSWHIHGDDWTQCEFAEIRAARP